MAVGLVSQQAQSSITARPQHTSNRFDDLVLNLKDVLGPSSGLDSKDVDLNSIMDLMEKYDATEKGWVEFAMADPELAYTRNLVDEGNGKSNLVSSSPDQPHLVCLCALHVANHCHSSSTTACPRVDPRQG